MLKLLLFVTGISLIIGEAVVDWRKSGAILPVPEKDEYLSSGTVNALDMLSAIRGAPATKMSAQEVFDCNPDWCICETKPNASQVITSINRHQLFAIDFESTYPYTGRCDHTCPPDKDIRERGFYYTFTGWDYPERNDEHHFLEFLDYSPVVVNVRSSSPTFQSYTGGIVDTNTCDGPLDHTLLLIGYGVENGVNYWILRNNWGTVWGEKGYVRLVRGKQMCGIGYGWVHAIRNKTSTTTVKYW